MSNAAKNQDANPTATMSGSRFLCLSRIKGERIARIFLEQVGRGVRGGGDGRLQNGRTTDDTVPFPRNSAEARRGRAFSRAMKSGLSDGIHPSLISAHVD